MQAPQTHASRRRFPHTPRLLLSTGRKRKKILWKINHMLVLKLCQQSSQLWGCFKPILMEAWGWGMGEGCIPFSDHRTEFFFFLYTRKSENRQTAVRKMLPIPSLTFIYGYRTRRCFTVQSTSRSEIPAMKGGHLSGRWWGCLRVSVAVMGHQD